MRSYLQAHLDLQTMYNIINLGVFRFENMGFATIFVTHTLNIEIPIFRINDAHTKFLICDIVDF